MKRFVYLIAILLATNLPAKDNFRTMVEQFVHIERSFSVVNRMQRGTIRYNDFMRKMDEFEKSCQEYQKTVEMYQVGNDLMFDKYVASLLLALKNASSEKFKANEFSKGSWLRVDEIPISHVFRLFRSDIRLLREQKLAHPPVSERLKPWIPLFEFERLFEYYRSVQSNFEVLSGNLAWSRMFNARLRLMRQAAAEAKNVLKQKKPKIADLIDLTVENDVLLEYFISVRKKDFFDNVNVKDSELRNLLEKKPVNQKNSEDDMKLALRNIDELFKHVREELEKDLQEEQAKKREEQEQARRKEREAKKEAENKANEQQNEKIERAKEDEKSKSQEIPVERLNENELAKRLDALREKYFPAADRKSLDKEQLEQCKRTLSADQLTQFESIRARYIRSGENEKKADFEAIRELYPLLNTKNFTPSKAETIRILKQFSTDSEK